MSLYLYRLRYSIQVLRHLIQEEFEERSWTEEDRDRHIRREGRGNHKLLLQYLIKLTNHIIIRGGEFFYLSALKVVVLVDQSVIIVNMFLFL